MIYKKDFVEVDLKNNTEIQVLEIDGPKNILILKQKDISNTFHVAMRFTMKVGQCISLFPIDLGSGNGTRQLEFRWLYWRTGYCLMSFICYFIELLLLSVHTFSTRLNFLTMVYFIFHLTGLIQFVLFFKLAYHLPKFARKWSEVDVSMSNYEEPTNLRLKLNLMTTFFMILGTVELCSGLVLRVKDSIDNHASISSAFKDMVQLNQHIINLVGNSVWVGSVIKKALNVAFADVFVMVIGTAISYRLRQVSKRIKTLSRLKVNNKTQWIVVRKDYNRLTELCQTVNSRISSIIIVSLLFNLYLILRKLFFSMQRMKYLMQVIYFYLSFGIWCARIMGLCIFGGAVYEEWKNIGLILNYVSTSAYNTEVERLTYHVHSFELSLSGNNFFKLSRGLILEIAGTIVTYGLVLIQYYHDIQY